MRPANAPISHTEFEQYSTAILNADVLRVLPACGEDDLSELMFRNPKDITNPYKSLLTGKAKCMQYMRYPEANTHAENFVGFVFVRINENLRLWLCIPNGQSADLGL